jgi:hypothetical protein
LGFRGRDCASRPCGFHPSRNPLFFAGIIFSSLIGEARINISTAFAYNLMGALFGGVMEYNSMYFRFAFLYLLALGFYGLAWAFSWKSASPIRSASLIAPGSSVS